MSEPEDRPGRGAVNAAQTAPRVETGRSGWRRWARRAARPLAWGLIVWPLVGCDPLDAMFDEVEPARQYPSTGDTGPSAPERLTVMTWNIKFAGGRIRFFHQCDGDRVVMERREVVEHLEGLAEAVRRVDPDVLMLQEVDVDSRRSAYVDQLQWLLERTPLSHAVYASQWDVPYVPRRGLGAVDSGNAILAKWPLREARRIALPLIGSQDPVTQYFYLKRNILRARLALPDRAPVEVVNTHLSAFSEDGTRRRQLRRLEDLLAGIDGRGRSFIVGGDFNLLPPDAERTHGFPDVRCEEEQPASDYRQTRDVLAGMYRQWRPAVPLETYAADPDRYRTFSADPEVFWTRKLDHVFTNRRFEASSALVHQDADRGGIETLDLSDHAPLSVVYPTEPPDR